MNAIATVAWGRGTAIAPLVSSLIEAGVGVLEIWYQDSLACLPKEAQDTLTHFAKEVPLIGEINSTARVHERLQRLPRITAIAEIFYTNIISSKVLDSVRVINIHPAPLPRYRGAHPLPWQIIHGETESAVTFHLVAPGIDAGPIVRQIPFRIEDNEGYTEVLDKVLGIIRAEAGQVVKRYLQGELAVSEQAHDQATFVVKRAPDDGWINWSSSSREIRNLVRALTSPLPGAWSLWNGHKVIIDQVEVNATYSAFVGRTCGQVAALSGKLAILTGDSAVAPRRVRDAETGRDITGEIRVNDRFTRPMG